MQQESIFQNSRLLILSWSEKKFSNIPYYVTEIRSSLQWMHAYMDRGTWIEEKCYSRDRGEIKNLKKVILLEWSFIDLNMLIMIERRRCKRVYKYIWASVWQKGSYDTSI